MGVRCNNKTYRWLTVPMGHSWSPAVAQSAGLNVLAHREKQEAALFDEEALRQGTLHPSKMDEASYVCSVTTTFVFGDEASVNEVHKRIERNKVWFNIELKYHRVSCGPETFVFRIRKYRERGADEMTQRFEWQHDPDRFKTYLDLFSNHQPPHDKKTIS